MRRPGIGKGGPDAATMQVHFKLFGTDGVSLQSQELTRALRGRGWRVHPCASDVPDGAEGLRLPELSFQSDDALALRRRLFQPGSSPNGRTAAGQRLLERVEECARPIRRRVEAYVHEHRVRLLHVRNVTSLPYNVPAMLAFHRLVADRPDLHFLLHHHDLHREGPNARSFDTPHREIADLIDRIACPDAPNTTHVVLNPLTACALRGWRGIEAAVVPDAFDFDRRATVIDEAAFRRRLAVLTGNRTPVTPDDLVVAMPARVAINKAIELAIQFVAGLERRRAELEDAPGGLGASRRRLTADGKIVLLLPQGEDVQDNREYFDRLVAYAAHLGVTLAYGGDVVVPDRRHAPGDRERYPFYSTYQAVDLVCYSPEHEGFGNQLVETVWARRPLVVLEYPIFEIFLRDHVPHHVSLGRVAALGRLERFGGLHVLQEDVLRRALDAAIAVLRDHDLERRWVDGNAVALRRFCGMDTVCDRYVEMYSPAGGAVGR